MNEYILPEGQPLPFKPIQPMTMTDRIVAKVVNKFAKRIGD